MSLLERLVRAQKSATNSFNFRQQPIYIYSTYVLWGHCGNYVGAMGHSITTQQSKILAVTEAVVKLNRHQLMTAYIDTVFRLHAVTKLTGSKYLS